MFAYMTRSPDPAVVGERWRDMWLERLRNLPLFPELWLRHPRRDEFWKHGSVCENYADIACAVYAVGGWTDGYPNAIPRLLAGLPGPRKGLIGPWGHRLPHFATPGPQIGFLQETLRWWDTWLKGVETGVMSEPLLRAWMQESVRPASWYAERPGRWVGEDTWPSASIENLVFFLTGAGLEHSPAAESRIALCSPETVGMLAGMWSVHGITPDEASDQREEDGKSLTFDSAVLEAGIEILGAAVLEIDLASDKPVAKLVVRLCDVSQDGASLRVSYGILNLTHRDSHAAPSALEPGRRYRIRIRMKETAHAFPRGHRIRVALSTTYWPMTWPTPERATLTIFAGGSWIGLPERKPRAQDSSLTPFGAAESAAPAAATVLAPGRFERTITRDLGAGVTTAILFDDYGVSRLEATGLEIASTRRYEFSIGEDDPLSARAEVRWTIEIGRGDWRTRSAIRIVQTATREAFLLRAQMEAFEGERSVMSRNSDCDVPRDLV
jgi:predicted acyl esterase